MYLNILQSEGIPTLAKYLHYFGKESDPFLPTHVIMLLLKLVMNNCIFKFGDTFWLQREGTAMGTPCACIYAILFFAYFERTLLLQKYKNNLLLYKRQIDDILGIWIDTPDNPNA